METKLKESFGLDTENIVAYKQPNTYWINEFKQNKGVHLLMNISTKKEIWNMFNINKFQHRLLKPILK